MQGTPTLGIGMRTLRPATHVARAIALLIALSTPAASQDALDIIGQVVEAETGSPLRAVHVAVQGADIFSVSDNAGYYRLPAVPFGSWVLTVTHEDYGSHEQAMAVSYGGEVEIEIRLGAEGMELTPRAVDRELLFESTNLTREAPSGEPAIRLAGTVVTKARIQQSVPSSRDLGDLIRQVVPALQLRDVEEDMAGRSICLEFPGAGVRSLATEASRACNSPVAYLDGVPSQDPSFVYSMTGLENIARIQAIPSAETGGQFGAAPYGVVLVETDAFVLRRGTYALAGGVPTRRGSTFDWDLDPAGHSFAKTFLGAFLGNAAGLAAGVAVARQCVTIADDDDIDFTCGDGGVAGVSVVAFALPALGTALGARLAGGTDLSVGKLTPAVLGASLAILPGYIFSLSTVGGGVETMNVVGQGFLVVGTPLFVTFADRLFRHLRD